MVSKLQDFKEVSVQENMTDRLMDCLPTNTVCRTSYKRLHSATNLVLEDKVICEVWLNK
jgi:hypothetical protein